MVQSMRENGLKEVMSEMEEVFRSGLMEVAMMDTGEATEQMGEDD